MRQLAAAPRFRSAARCGVGPTSGVPHAARRGAAGQPLPWHEGAAVNLQVLESVALILSIGLNVAVIALVLFAIPAFKELRQWLRGSETLHSLVKELRPTLTNAAENVNYLSAAFRSDADEVGRTVRRATETANVIIDTARDRTAEISGFLEVVQEEAESSFLSTASLLRGARATRRVRGKHRDREIEKTRTHRRLG